VREHYVGEDWPGDKTRGAAACRAVFFYNFSASDVRRHQVGRELYAVKAQVKGLSERFDEQGLSESGHAAQQTVAAARERDHALVYDLSLPDDDLRNLSFKLRNSQGQCIERRSLFAFSHQLHVRFTHKTQ